MSKLFSLIFAVVAISHPAGASAADLTNMRCEHLVNPLGIDVEKPRLSWVIEERSQKSEIGGQRSEVGNKVPIRCWWRVRKSC